MAIPFPQAELPDARKRIAPATDQDCPAWGTVRSTKEWTSVIRAALREGTLGYPLDVRLPADGVADLPTAATDRSLSAKVSNLEEML